jgi:AmiR/NasT family two-component response regulator
MSTEFIPPGELTGTPDQSPRFEASPLDSWFAVDVVVHQAAGVLKERHQIPVEEAFASILNEAAETGTDVVDIAAAIVSSAAKAR